MQLGPALMQLSELRPHEATTLSRVRKSAHMHVRWGAMRRRVVVDAVDHVVLDGHHRLAVAHRLGLRCVPVLLVDPTEVALSRRGSEEPLLHSEVVDHVLLRGVMPPRSTKYDLSAMDVTCSVSLDRLRHPPAGSP